MQLKGKLLKLLPLQTGEGKSGTWKKQEFIIETEGNFPKKVCLSLWGDKINMLQGKEGGMVVVDFDIESREYNGRWFTEARAWKVDGDMKSSNQTATSEDDLSWIDSQQSIEDDGDLPF